MKTYLYLVMALLLFSLPLIAGFVFGASGSFTCSGNVPFNYTASTIADPNYVYYYKYYVHMWWSGNTYNSHFIQYDYIYGLKVYSKNFWSNGNYNWSFILVSNPLTVNYVNYTVYISGNGWLGADGISCFSTTYYETNADLVNITQANKGDKINITYPTMLYYVPEPIPNQDIFFNLKLTAKYVNTTSQFTAKILDFGIGYVNFSYPENKFTVYDSSNNKLIEIQNNQLLIEGKITWNGTNWAVHYLEFNKYHVDFMTYSSKNYVLQITPDNYTVWEIGLPYASVDTSNLPQYQLSKGFIQVEIVNRYLDDLNTELRENKTVSWYYDSSSDTGYYKLNITNTTMVNLTKYEHYRVITITNSDATYNNVFVEISLDKTLNDFYPSAHNSSQIAFSLDQSRTQLLNYKIVVWDTQNEKAKFKVEIPTLNTGSNTIYMWYDTGQDYTSYQISNLTYTDNFEDGDFNGWVGDTSEFAIDSPGLQGSNFAVKQITSDTTGILFFDGVNASYMDVSVYFKSSVSTGTSFGAGVACLVQDASNFYMARVGGAGKLEIYKVVSDSVTLLASVSVSTSANVEYKLRFVCDGKTGSLTAYLMDVNDNILNQVSATDSTYNTGSFGFGSHWFNSGASVWFDNVFAITDNTVTTVSVSVGSEQTGNPVGWYWGRPRQIVFQFQGNIKIDYAVVDNVQVTTYQTYDNTNDTSIVYVPWDTGLFPNGFTSLTVYWHLDNASNYGFGSNDPNNNNSGSSSSIGLNSGQNTNLNYKLFFYLLPLIAGLVSFVLWGIAGLGVAALVNMYLAIAGVGSYWISYVLVLGLIFFILYKIMRGGIG